MSSRLLLPGAHLCNQQDHFIKFSLMIRQQLRELKNIKKVNKIIRDYLKNGSFYKIFLEPPISSRNKVFKVWAYHCECVVAQRLRRCHQMFYLYSKWWEERALKELIKKMRQSFAKKGKEFALGAVGISAYNWEENRISDIEIKSHANEFDYVMKLKENTICLSCDPTSRTNINTNICKCGTTGKLSTKTYDEWQPFIEKQDLIVWRRQHPSGQYEFKMFGSYNDVSAEDFLNVQIDSDYRRKWDKTAVVLEVAETDRTPNSNSDILYWEMLWPRLFVNRDYVYNRRYLVDNESKTIFIVSRSTEHPNFPKNPEKYRIEDYQSCMIIRPYEDMKKPVTTWVATRAMPDFLDRLREATKNYRTYCLTEGQSKACKIVAEEERAAEAKKESEKLDYCNFIPNQNDLKARYLEPGNEETHLKRQTGNAGVTKHNFLWSSQILMIFY
ncbi:hypothetical protein JTB14_020957 [Gonioctena quinquepunctata]|nr:hypothetical protein JTB14_020957 [Gonioctena quinquepunctata]